MNREEEAKKEMNGALEHLKQELKNLRTGRANPLILDNVLVDVYGSKMKIKALANISVPEPRQIVVTPFDRSNLSMICKAIEDAKLNLQPVVENNMVRIKIPPMDESIRKEMVKKCKVIGETIKVRIREIRRKFNDLVRKAKESGDATEDQVKREEKKIQELTDKFCKDIDTVCSEKEKEILEV
ncbi:MAG: ribosome recycling factor [Chlamydiae bacterium]|nr:ribosome recycling factor [Chlamydiota bacterium]